MMNRSRLRSHLRYPNTGSVGSASLDINFLSGILDTRVTFSRASSATVVNSSGLIELVSTNVPRFDYDPITLQPKGLLIEEQRTNLLSFSEQFDNAAWVKFGTTAVTPNTAISPTGVLVADGITIPTNSGIYQIRTATASTTYTASVYIRGGTTQTVRVLSNTDTSGFVSSTVNVTPTWQRVAIQKTTGLSDTVVSLQIDSSSTGAPFEVWGAQLEVGAFPTSYIPTTSAAATRAADIATISGTNFSSWFSNDEGVIYVESSIPYTSLNNRGPIRFDDTTDSNRIMIRNGGASSRLDGRVVTGGTSIANLETALTAISPNVKFKAAMAYKLNDFAMSVNGLSVATDNLGAVPIVSRLLLGDAEMTTAVKGSTISRIVFFPRRLSNAELQQITS